MSFKIRVRGGGGTILLEYLCDEHGRFETHVDRAESPDVVPCPTCGAQSPWSPSAAPALHVAFVVSATQGKSAPKPHRDAMDTRLIAEGRRNEYRAQRKKVKEERRHQRVKALLS